MKSFPIAIALLAVVLGALTAAGCSLLLDFEECASNGDCSTRAPGLVCSTEGYCVAGAPECSEDADCSDKGARSSCSGGVCTEPAGNNGDVGDVGDVPDMGGDCTLAECIAERGDNHICGVNGSCVNLLTPQCTRIAGPVDRDDTVIIGSILPTVEFGDLGIPIENAVVLAVEEINDRGGLPGGRSLGLVGCDSSGDAELGEAAAKHLVEVVGVPAMVGPAFSGVFIGNISLITEAGTLMMSPSATSPNITDQQDNGLAWRTVASDVFQGVASSDLIRDRGYLKVAAIGKGDAYGEGLLNKLSEEVGTELGIDNYVPRTYDESAPDFGAIVTDVLDELPDVEVIVLFGTSEVVELLALFETEINNRGLLIMPDYLLADGGKSELLFATIQNAAPLDDELRARISGTEPDHQNGAVFQAYQLRYQAAFPRSNAGIFTPNSYDATYLLAYAMMTIDPDDEITGAAIAAGMSNLVSGPLTDVGPSAINQARNALTVGNSIDFVGASGPLDFNLDTGEAPANVALWAVEERQNGDLRFTTAMCYLVGDDGTGDWAACPE
jgi:ABC-type branched-subunit amino acid transport system substrate-binding protein